MGRYGEETVRKAFLKTIESLSAESAKEGDRTLEISGSQMEVSSHKNTTDSMDLHTALELREVCSDAQFVEKAPSDGEKDSISSGVPDYVSDSFEKPDEKSKGDSVSPRRIGPLSKRQSRKQKKKSLKNV